MPLVTLLYFATGPMMIISGYFQAIGDTRRALTLSVTRTYLFNIPLIFFLPYLLGANGIWLAGPAAEVLMIVAWASCWFSPSALPGFAGGCCAPARCR